MSKKLIFALVLMAVMVIVLILNTRGTAIVSLGFKQSLETMRAAVYFGFIAIGVVIGLLLK